MDQMAAPIKNGHFEHSFVNVTRGPKVSFEPNFHDDTTSNIKDYPGKPKMGQFLTQGPYGSPAQKWKFKESGFFSCYPGSKKRHWATFHEHTTSNVKDYPGKPK